VLAEVFAFAGYYCFQVGALAGKIVEHLPVEDAKALVSEGLAKLSVEEVQAHITEALHHVAETGHEKLAPFLATVLTRVHTPGDAEGLKRMLGEVLDKLHAVGEEGKEKAGALEAALHDKASSAEDRLKALTASLRALDAETMKAMVKAVLAHAMADAAGAKETLKEMTHMGATSEGRHLLAAQAHALVLSSKDHLKVSRLFFSHHAEQRSRHSANELHQ
jgi:hypothetical protein